LSKSALVLGGGGFIGNHIIQDLKKRNYRVEAIDLKLPQFSESQADQFHLRDLRDPNTLAEITHGKIFTEVYQLAADMGGAGYIFTGKNDADIMHNSALINLNTINAFKLNKESVLFFSSSACVYPVHNQDIANSPNCPENNVYPANPDSDYGWEKLFSERIYEAFSRNYDLNIRIARFHNIFGPENVYEGGREKAPAAICRKVAAAKENDTIEIWGDGLQTRSFLYITECLKGIEHLMKSNFKGPINVGSDQIVTINQLAQMIIEISGKKLSIKNIPGPEGVRGRNSDNRLILDTLGWKPTQDLALGLKYMYDWIANDIDQSADKLVADVNLELKS
jgi:GDP-D-mannose 3',5'-epimerase